MTTLLKCFTLQRIERRLVGLDAVHQESSKRASHSSCARIDATPTILWAGLPVTRVHAAAQRSMTEAGRHGRKRSCGQPLTERMALVSVGQQ
jgi:hypothetical protein